jgi:hypothetical protein
MRSDYMVHRIQYSNTNSPPLSPFTRKEHKASSPNLWLQHPHLPAARRRHRVRVPLLVPLVPVRRIRVVRRWADHLPTQAIRLALLDLQIPSAYLARMSMCQLHQDLPLHLYRYKHLRLKLPLRQPMSLRLLRLRPHRPLANPHRLQLNLRARGGRGSLKSTLRS